MKPNPERETEQNSKLSNCTGRSETESEEKEVRREGRRGGNRDNKKRTVIEERRELD